MGPEAAGSVFDLSGRFADCEESKSEFAYISIKFNIKPGFIEKGALDGIWNKDLLEMLKSDEVVNELKYKTEIIDN